MNIQITLTLEQIEAKATYWEDRLKELGRKFKDAPRSSMGLVSEEIRVSPEYQANRRLINEAFEQIRYWNKILVKVRKLRKKE